MLQLFGPGLISLWLKFAGVQTVPMNIREIMSLANSPGLVFVPDPNPVGMTTVQQYLQGLAAQGVVTANQGLWMQSGPILLANHRGTVPVPAASLTKIATALAALKTWGPNYRFETLISATGALRDGVLHGDLVVQGGGDPLFIWEEAITLGRSLNALGIKRVTGNLVITGNFAMNYLSNPLLAGQMLKQGLDARLWSPVTTVEFLQHFPHNTPRPQVAIAGTVKVEGENLLSTQKQILLLRHRSLPLVQIMREMNIYSNNEMAQMLADSLGGAQVVQQLAATASGVPQSEIQMVNGSGLGVNNRLSPRAVCAMLGAIERELQSYHLSLADLFAIAGRDRRGTIETRQIPNATVVKTGTLNEVSSLAGVMPTRDRGLVWFAIINHGSNVDSFRTQQDQLLQHLLQKWQAALTLPAALTPHLTSDTTNQLGATSRNEGLYKRS
ncbi:MAG: D-alanyl-D-alanine carboxypeptidase [Chroococcidiopsidaceae cyanobacterium CP_BM_ER_R8_30]|nr:D-alanyl-D-alanine carboxypeptidase [Chroococcidiopsidaceae cyanobacterium CP_BM_ER_R8_30]